nr:histidine phosphatase family protein [Acholeplasmatales bacterium]
EFKKNYDSSLFIKMKKDECFLNGESYNLFYERIKKAFINLLNKYKNKKILIVTHGGVITVILSLIYGYPYNFNLQIGPETGSIIRF